LDVIRTDILRDFAGTVSLSNPDAFSKEKY